MTEPKRYSLFYLEDHGPTLDKIKHWLPQAGPWTVSGETDEKRALKVVSRQRFDLYLIDEVLSEWTPSNQMVGSEVVEELRKMRIFSKLSPIVIFSQLVTDFDLKAFGQGSGVWMRTHDYYEMRRVEGNLAIMSRNLLQILEYHRLHPV